METHPYSVRFVFRDPARFLAELTVQSRRLVQSPHLNGCVTVQVDCADPAEAARAAEIAARTGGVVEQAPGRGPDGPARGRLPGVAGHDPVTIPIDLLPEDVVPPRGTT